MGNDQIVDDQLVTEIKQTIKDNERRIKRYQSNAISNVNSTITYLHYNDNIHLRGECGKTFPS